MVTQQVCVHRAAIVAAAAIDIGAIAGSKDSAGGIRQSRALNPTTRGCWCRRSCAKVGNTVRFLRIHERQWHRADGQKKEQVKRASEKMRFSRRANVRFHSAYAPVSKHLYSKRVEDVETFRVINSPLFELARVLVRLDHVASRIANANHSIV
jgi:hypothetical protein